MSGYNSGYISCAGQRKRLKRRLSLCKYIEERDSKSKIVTVIFRHRFTTAYKPHVLCHLSFISALSTSSTALRGDWHLLSLKATVPWHEPPFHTYFLYVTTIRSKPSYSCCRNSNLSFDIQNFIHNLLLKSVILASTERDNINLWIHTS